MLAKVSIINTNTAHPKLRESVHDGARFVGGTLGQTYSIQIENLTSGRVLAVITVDGRNVLDASRGDTAGPGYVIGGRSTVSVDGWRTSESSVAAFVLTSTSASYAAATLGDASNVGVIGVAVFAEYHDHRWLHAPRPTPAVGRSASYGDLDLRTFGSQPLRSAGTGFGDEHRSVVTTTTFTRVDVPEIHVINYDTIDALIGAGLMSKMPAPEMRAQPFPASAPAFCPCPAAK